MSSLEYGEHYPLPLDPYTMELFYARMQDQKRVIGMAHFILKSSDEHLSIPVKNFEMLWLCGFIVTHQGEAVTSKDIVFHGFPHNVSVKDPFAPIQKRMKSLSGAGLPIANTGGRQGRRYHLPHYASAEIEYVEDPRLMRTKDDRFSYTSDIKQRAGDVLDTAISRVKKAADFKLPSLAHGLDEIFPLHKRARANCRGVDPNLFVSDDIEVVAHAIRICNSCSVRTSCREYAIAGRLHGVWGGEYFPLEDVDQEDEE